MSIIHENPRPSLAGRSARRWLPKASTGTQLWATRQQPVRRTVRVRLPVRLPRPLGEEDADVARVTPSQRHTSVAVSAVTPNRSASWARVSGESTAVVIGCTRSPAAVAASRTRRSAPPPRNQSSGRPPGAVRRQKAPDLAARRSA